MIAIKGRGALYLFMGCKVVAVQRKSSYKQDRFKYIYHLLNTALYCSYF